MLSGLNRPIQWYYFFALVMIVSGMGGISYYYWKSGLMDISYISSLHEVSANLEDLSKSDNLEKIHGHVRSDQVKLAVKQFTHLENKINEINNAKNLKKFYGELDESSKELKKTMLKLLSYPELSSIIKVFDGKIDKFKDYVLERKWQTLSRVSSRISSRIFDIKTFSFERIKSLNRSIVQDISIMRNIAESSSLQKEDINNILIRLQSIQIELNMLQSILSDMESFFSKYEKFEKDYYAWLGKVQPEVSLEKIRLTEKNRYFILGILGNILMGALLLMVGFLVYSKNKRHSQKKVEEFALKLVRENLLAANLSMSNGFSAKFRMELEKIHHYLQKRLSFSSIFQSSLPFSSLLLDSNLNVIWANSSFCEVFRLENCDLGQKSLSWDYLLRFTNLGDSDPVIESLQNDLSGIYQILVKIDQNSPAIPYEMYVSPTVRNNHKFIMIFFYPLTSLQETIHNQGLTLVDPIKRTLDTLIKGDFTKDFQQNIAKDFDLAGIRDIHERFSTYVDFVTTQKMGLLGEIDRLENELSDYHKILGDVYQINLDSRAVIDGFWNNLRNVKKTIVSFVELSNGFKENYSGLIDINSDLLTVFRNAVTSFKDLVGKLNDCKSSIENISGIRYDMKMLKNNLYNINTRLSQTLDQVLIFERVDHIEKGRFDQALNKIKADVKSIGKEIQGLEKTMTHLDIQMSKTETILQGGEQYRQPDYTDSLQDKITEVDNKLDDNLFHKTHFSQTSSFLEDKIVKDLQLIFENYKLNVKGLESVGQLISDLMNTSSLAAECSAAPTVERKEEDGLIPSPVPVLAPSPEIIANVAGSV